MNLCSECGLDHDLVREACKKSLFTTASLLCDFKDLTPRFHGRICEWVQDNLVNGRRRMLVLVPRGTFKTSLLTISGSVWFLINDFNNRVLIIQQSGKKAEQTMRGISPRLLSGPFKHYFGELVPDKGKREVWNLSDIQINRTEIYPEASISSRGVDSRIVGGHYTVHFPDDLIDLKEAESETQMESALTFLQNKEPLFVSPRDGVEIACGTRWGNNDVYQYMIDSGTYEILEAGAYVDERCVKYHFNDPGKPIFPERLDKEALDQIRARTNNDFIFACQYLNKPYSDDVMRFPPSCFQYYAWRDVGKTLVIGEEVIHVERLSVTMTVDPSMGESKSADESAITIVGMDSQARIFILDAWSGRVNPIGLIEKIFRMQEQWKPTRVGIETVAFQKALQYFIRQEQAKRGKHFPIDELKTGSRSKEVRIEGLSPYFTNKQVWMHRSQSKLQKQLQDFPSATGHDDLADALAYQPSFWREGRTTEDPEALRELDAPEDEEMKAYGLRCAN